MKKFIAALFMGLILCTPAFALEATIPQFDVYIGTDKLEFKNADYPLLVYKDITYFPMTYDYIHWLDLTSSWIDGEFYIGFHRDNNSYLPTGPAAWQSNPKVCNAEIAKYKIFVNGKEIDNSKEEYPLLNFRGITYFPMTWRFATEEFNLKLSWDGNFHIDKNYDEFPLYPYAVKDSKAYFGFNTWTEIINENGDITYSEFVDHNAYFDAANKKFELSETEVDEQLPEVTSAEATIEKGILMYKGRSIADLTDYVGEKSASDDLGYNTPMVYGNEYSLGDMTLLSAVAYDSSFPSPHKFGKGYAFLINGDDIINIKTGNNLYVDKVMEVGGKYYVSFSEGMNWGYTYSLVEIDADGEFKIYNDEDHKSVKLIDEIDGKPLVLATMNNDQYGDVSLVNDGFFTYNNGSLEKYFNFVQFSDSFVIDNTLYLVLEFKGKIINTKTGEEFDYNQFVQEQF